ncbi:MAG: glycosyltransferase [Clostridia bacterium]|nr:glycosyltransferase [Clostridia bacterium]
MKKPIIWQMNGVMNAGGTESLIMELLRKRPENVEVVLVVHSSDANAVGVYDEEIRSLGIPMYYLPSVGSVGFQKYKRAFNDLVVKIGKPDVVHSHMNAVGGFISAAAKSCGIPCRIVHCHADIKYYGSRLSVMKSEFLLALMKIFVNSFATHYWACSKAAADRLFYKTKKATVIPNVIDVEKCFCDIPRKEQERKKLGVTDDRLVIGGMGRVARIKNYEVILDALGALVADGVDAHFYCYGRTADEQYMVELKERIHRLGIKDRVHFLGNTTSVADSLAAFDVFVMPSVTEGLGIAALEAQAVGLPVILSTGVPAETDMGLGTVSRVGPFDVMGWKTAIKSIEKCEVSHKKIKEAFVKNGFDAKTKCIEIYELYREICEVD